VSGPSYLARLAGRATRSLASVRPPRHWGRTAEVPLESPAEPYAAVRIVEPGAARALENVPPVTLPREVVTASIREEIVPVAAPRPAPAIPSSPRPADFIFPAPRRPAPPPAPTTPAKAEAVPEREALAMLATVVQWTSSPPPATRDPIDAAPSVAIPAPRAVLPSVRPDSPPVASTPTPVRTTPTTVRVATPPPARILPTQAPAHSVPPPSPDHFTTIHIGSVEVEVVAPPSPPASEAPGEPASSAPITRGLSSAIGLRQS
jgi:hypothetical protein